MLLALINVTYVKVQPMFLGVLVLYCHLVNRENIHFGRMWSYQVSKIKQLTAQRCGVTLTAEITNYFQQ